MQKKMFIYYFFPCLLIFILEMFYYFFDCKYQSLIFLSFIFEFISIVFLVKNKLVFSPAIFADLYLFFLLTYQIKLVKTYSDLSFSTIYLIFISMFLWKIINIYDGNIIQKSKLKKSFSFDVDSKKFRIAIYILFSISTFFMILEWYVAGGIPALRADSEIFRFNVSINGITHILAISNKIVAILILSYFMGNKISILKQFDLLCILFLSVLQIFLTSMRGELAIILFTFVSLYYLSKNPKIWKIICVTIPLLLMIGIFPIIRKYGIYGENYIVDQKALSTYRDLWYLTPLYQTFTDSIRVLDIVVKMIPNYFSFGFLDYSILPQIPFVDIGKDLSYSIAQYLNSYFYSGLTSTYLGPAYADLGVFGAILYTVIFSLFGRGLYVKYVEKRSFKYTILYIFCFFHIIMLSYGTMANLPFVVYYFLILILCNFFEKKENKYENSIYR